MTTRKELEAAILDSLAERIDYNNRGMTARTKASARSLEVLRAENVRVFLDRCEVTQNGEPVYKIERRFAKRKTQGCYKELKPVLRRLEPEGPSAQTQEKQPAEAETQKETLEKGKTMSKKIEKNAQQQPEKKAEPVRIWAKAQPIKALASVASKDKSRPILGAIEIEAGNDVWRVVATDSYRLAMFESGDVDAEKNTARVCISAAHAAKALKASDDVVEVLEVNEAEKLAKVLINDKKHAGRLEYWPIVEGTFPDWRKLKPAGIRPEKIEAHAFAVNPEYLAAAAQIVTKTMPKTASVTVWTEGPTKPAFIAAEGPEYNAFSLVMPVRTEHLTDLAKKAQKDTQKAASDSSAEHAAELENMRLKSWDEGYDAAKKALAEQLEKEKAEAVAEALEAYKKAQKAAEVPPSPKTPEPEKAEPQKAEKPAKKAEKPQKIEAQEPEAEDLAELAERFPELAFMRKSAGSCIWCTGDTKPRKEELKAEGFRWSGKRQAWYKMPEKAENQAA